MTTLRQRWTFGASLSFALLAGACAQDVGDIDRTQANKIQKDWFEGEWHMLHTVIDVNATAESSFTGSMGDLERVEFEIVEEMLFARRVHEDIFGIDTADVGVEGQLGEFLGSAPAAWRITDHFDVQRQYNSTTGEETNVITENRSDREWYDRDYMRVDWTNQNAPLMSMDSLMWAESDSSFAIRPQDNGTEPTFVVEENEDGEVVYIDIVRDYVVEPDWWSCVLQVGFPNWGTDCGPETITVRTSIARIDERIEDRHVPRIYSDYDMAEFGYFRNNGCLYDARRGCTDSSALSFAANHDIWTNNRDAEGNVLPFEDRTPDPIAYYLSEIYPWDLIDEAYEIGAQYDMAFRRAVAAAQGSDAIGDQRMFYACLNPGTTDPTVPEDLLAQVHNPDDRELLIEAYAASAEGYANGECERAGVVKNRGDVRYSMFSWVNEPNAPWFGYGPTAVDRTTGESISGVANFNGGYLNIYAQRVLDIVNIMEGDLTPEEMGYGVAVREYFEQLRDENDGDLYYGINIIPEDKSVEEITNQRITREVRQLRNVDRNARIRREQWDNENILNIAARPQSDMRRRSELQLDPLRALRNTRLEQQLIIPELATGLSGGQVRGNQQVPEELMDLVSPARHTTVQGFQRMYEEISGARVADNIMMAEPFDQQLIGFAEDIYRYKAELEVAGGLTAWEIEEELWREIRGRVYTGVQSHEVGHTVGLRHNFAATTDALNYFPQYWSLRQQTFDDDCDGAGYRTFTAIGLADGNVAPIGCGAPETDEVRAQRNAEVMGAIASGVLEDGTQLGSINHFEYSSVMDYHGEVNGRQGGLGMYDYAALLYSYGYAVEVFQEAPYVLDITARYNGDSFSGTDTERSTSRVIDMNDVDNYVIDAGAESTGDVFGDAVRDAGWIEWHYSVLPMMFYDDGATEVSNGDSLATSFWQNFDYTGVGPMAPMYQRDIVRLDNLTETDLVVPYEFCSDFIRGDHPRCNLFDSGADPNEMVSRIIEDYESNYPLNYFRRERPGFGLSLWPRISSDMTRTFGAAINHFQWWIITLSDDNRDLGWAYSDRGGEAGLEAAIKAVDFVGRALTIPNVGYYVLDRETGMWINSSNDPNQGPEQHESRLIANDGELSLNVADGARFGRSTYTGDEDSISQRPYYYFFEMEVMSHFYSKYAAIMAMVDGNISLVGSDASSNPGGFYITTFDVFPDQVANYLGGIIAEDYQRIGGCVTQEDGEYVVENLGPFDEGACFGDLMNPYSEEYGRRDYNMRMFTTVFSAGMLQETLEFDWLNRSSIYTWGETDSPEIFDTENFEWLTYTDEMGITYGARLPIGFTDADLDDEPYVNYTLIRSAQLLQEAVVLGECYEEGLVDEFTCEVDLTASLGDIERCSGFDGMCENVREPGDAGRQLDSLTAQIRFLVETNELLYNRESQGWF